MRKLLLALLVTVAFPLGAQAAAECTIRAAETIVEDQVEALLESCTKVLKANPRDSEARYVRGSLLGGVGRDAEAIEDLNYSILLAPKFADAYYNRSAAYLALGEWRKAYNDATKAVELDPGNGGAFHNRALAREQTGDLAGAVEDFTRAIELGYSRNHGSTYRFRANTLSRAGRWQEALADYSRAIEDLDGTDRAEAFAEVHNGRAWALYKLGRAADGLSDVEASIATDAANAASLDTRAHIFEAMGDTDAAIRDYRRALEIDPELAESKEGLQRLTE